MTFDRPRARPFTLPFPPLILALIALLLGSAWLKRVSWLSGTEQLTRGTVQPEFLVSVIALGVLLVVMLGSGKVTAADIGLDRDMLARGGGITLMTWAATQVIGVLPRVVAEDPVAIHRAWLHGSALEIGGTFLTALGGATVAEVALRGCLLVQLYLLFHRDPKHSRQGLGWAVAITVLVGNAIALLAKWPAASTRELLITQAIAAGIGLYLSWMFVRTKNLFFTIGVHTLILAPTPVVAGLRGEPVWFFPGVIAAVAAVWVLLWPRRD